MTSPLAKSKQIIDAHFQTFFLQYSYFLTFLNIHIYFIILKTYDQQFTLTTKKSLHIIFKTNVATRDVLLCSESTTIVFALPKPRWRSLQHSLRCLSPLRKWYPHPSPFSSLPWLPLLVTVRTPLKWSACGPGHEGHLPVKKPAAITLDILFQVPGPT